MTNLVPHQYREVAMASVDFPIDADRLSQFLLGREVYKRTRYVVVRHGVDTAIVEVEKAPGNQVMAVVTSLAVLAWPAKCAFVTAPDVDTGIPSSLARAAREYAPSARAVVVEGRYHHVNFILEPSPVVIRVVDVVPPMPPKLFDQASRVLEMSEDLPPIELVPDVVDLADLARAHPARRYLLPCRGSGFVAAGNSEVAFLDERPPRGDWTLIGCARSQELHRWFYGDLPQTVDMCPRVLAASSQPEGGGSITLTKCCLLEDRIDRDRNTVVVPWGASLAQVRQGLAAATAATATTTTVAEAAGASGDGLEATWSPA